jgi:DNA-directed RNA polymerase specialized sigma24 family protein
MAVVFYRSRLCLYHERLAEFGGLRVSQDIDPEEVAETDLDVKRLVQDLVQLAKAQCEVIELGFAAGLPTGEAAKIIGNSQMGVKVVQPNPLETLRKVFLYRSSHEKRL